MGEGQLCGSQWGSQKHQQLTYLLLVTLMCDSCSEDTCSENDELRRSAATRCEHGEL